MPELNYAPNPVPETGKHYAFGPFGTQLISGTDTPTAPPQVRTRDYRYFKDSDNTTWYWRGTAGATSWQQEA